MNYDFYNFKNFPMSKQTLLYEIIDLVEQKKQNAELFKDLE